LEEAEKKFEEKREYEEYDGERKTLYYISVDYVDEENIVRELTLRRRVLPLEKYANSYGWEACISFLDGKLNVRVKEFAYEWGGTFKKTVGEISIKTDFEELPWFTDRIDLAKTIKDFGVKKAMECIIDYIKDVISNIIPK